MVENENNLSDLSSFLDSDESFQLPLENYRDSLIIDEETGEVLGVRENEETTIESLQVLKSKGVEEAISGERVKSVIIKENDDVEIPNFTIDISENNYVMDIQTLALDSILRENGDTALYILDEKLGLIKIGYGDRLMLNKVLPRIIYNVFGPEYKIYADFQIGKQAKLFNQANILTKRMNI